MNDADVIKKLEQVDLSGIVLPNHQRQLGQALLTSGCFNESNKESKIMTILKRTSPLGAGVAIVAVVAAVVFGVKIAASGSAQKAAQSSQKTVAVSPNSGATQSGAEGTGFNINAGSSGRSGAVVQSGGEGAVVQQGQGDIAWAMLPPAVQATLQAARDFSRLSLEDKLKLAQTAKDSTKLTSAQYLRQNPNMAGYKPSGGNGKTLAELKLTYFKFTTSFGGKCVVGVDTDSGLPVMAIGGGGASGGTGGGGGRGGGGGGGGSVGR